MTQSSVESNPASHIRKVLLQQCRVAGLRGGPREYRLDESYLLYLTGEQSLLYLEAVATPAFRERLYEPYSGILTEASPKILASFKRTCAFIDLGPGNADRSLPLINALTRNGTSVVYIPVDISRFFLNIAESSARRKRLQVRPLHCMFSEVPDKLKGDTALTGGYRRFVNIGFTFNNFPASEILPLLRRIAGKDGYALIATEVVDQSDVASMIRPYQQQKAERFNYALLKIAGIPHAELKYFARYRDSRIEMGFTCLRAIAISPDCTIRAGSTIITSVSYRYTERDLLHALHAECSNVTTYNAKGSTVAIASFTP